MPSKILGTLRYQGSSEKKPSVSLKNAPSSARPSFTEHCPVSAVGHGTKAMVRLVESKANLTPLDRKGEAVKAELWSSVHHLVKEVL